MPEERVADVQALDGAEAAVVAHRRLELVPRADVSFVAAAAAACQRHHLVEKRVEAPLGQLAHVETDDDAEAIAAANVGESGAKRLARRPVVVHEAARHDHNDALGRAEYALVLAAHFALHQETATATGRGATRAQLVNLEVVLELRQLRHELAVDPGLVAPAEADGRVVVLDVGRLLVVGPRARTQQQVAPVVHVHLQAASERQHKGEHEQAHKRYDEQKEKQVVVAIRRRRRRRIDGLRAWRHRLLCGSVQPVYVFVVVERGLVVGNKRRRKRCCRVRFCC